MPLWRTEDSRNKAICFKKTEGPIITMETKKQDVKCPKCSHPFKTKSKLGLISCNCCGAKFKREDNLTNPKSQRKLK